MSIQLTSSQLNAVNSLQTESVFLSGPPGCGKTTVALAYLRQLINSGINPENILILIPQRTLAAPYGLLTAEKLPGNNINIATLGGIAKRMIQLFWPLILENNIIPNGQQLPKFLTLETAQYHAAKLFDPLIDRGYFDSVTIDRNRIYSQILDNLNKASLLGIPHTQIGERLKSAWVGKPEQIQIYDEVQECASLLRHHCLDNCLLDYSLQVEIFTNSLWQTREFRDYFFSKYQYLVFDNIEEDAPITHDLVTEWLPSLENYLLIFDSNGGYRIFLGADPTSGKQLSQQVDKRIHLEQSFILSDDMAHLQNNLTRKIMRESVSPNRATLDACLTLISKDYYPELVEETCREIEDLVNNHEVNPKDICILSPFLSDSLRFTFSYYLNNSGIPLVTNRPSRSLRDEPAAQCLITLLKLLYPHWGLEVTQSDIRQMLMQAINSLDLVRADILSKIIFRRGDVEHPLNSFDLLNPEMQERITHSVGERYEILKDWLLDNRSSHAIPMDIVISKLFGEVLAQPGFGFYHNFDSAEVTLRLIESIYKFGLSGSSDTDESNQSIGKEYIEMLNKGVIAALHVQQEAERERDAVYLAPAYTYLMQNRSVRFQFWLDIGSQGWWERLNQPLTHPHVLSRQWNVDQKWTDSFEYDYNQQTMVRIVSGLVSRCEERIFLCQSRYNEQGNDQQGPLLKAFNLLMRDASRQVDHDV